MFHGLDHGQVIFLLAKAIGLFFNQILKCGILFKALRKSGRFVSFSKPWICAAVALFVVFMRYELAVVCNSSSTCTHLEWSVFHGQAQFLAHFA